MIVRPKRWWERSAMAPWATHFAWVVGATIEAWSLLPLRDAAPMLLSELVAAAIYGRAMPSERRIKER